ncbi:MAG: alpha-L-fucosidase [Victivallales bacterium]|nr:alpha-L-fucosidase [Victivallales bacterium]
MAMFNYSFFYDFHTLATIPDVGAKFDADKFADQLKSCGIDFLTFHARCNQGSAYYNTKVGKRHQSLTHDMIGSMVKACHARGIRVSTYFNGHLSDQELVEHPEWMEQHIESHDRLRNGPFYRTTCYNTFGPHMLEMAKELAADYDVDGFFFDCLGRSDCICPTCVEKMRKQGVDPTDPKAVERFNDESCYEMCRMLHDELLKVKPNLFFFFNGRPFENMLNLDTQLECECLPTGGWGYDTLPLMSHYLRTICKPGSCVLNMTGRFNSWGDFGSLRTREGVEYDLLYGVANGMRPDLSDHLHPRGDWPEPIAQLTRDVYHFLQRYDKWALDAVNKPEIAVVRPRHNNYAYYPRCNALVSAVRMLTELKVQFDVVSDMVDWAKYKLLIFADDVLFTDQIVTRVKAHLARGGAVIATGESGLTPEKDAFALSDEWPAVYVGKSPYDPLYFQPESRIAAGLPDLPLVFYSTGEQVKAAEGAETFMYCVKPYFNKGWDGIRTNFYIPPQEKTDMPFVLRKGNIFYVAGNLFEGYFNMAMKDDRVIIENILKELDTEPQLKTANLPSFARAFLQFKNDWRLVHVLTYCPEKRMTMTQVEDRPTVLNAVLSVRTDGKPVKKVYLAPTGQELPFVDANGYCTVTVPQIDGYALVVFE